MENKNRFIRLVAVIGILVMVIVTVLPGCNFVGKAKVEEPTQAVDVNEEAQLCCPVCSSTDIEGPDADGYYTCKSCSARWTFKEDEIEVVDEKGNVVDTLDKSAGYVNGAGSNNNASAADTDLTTTGGNNASGNNSGSGNSNSGSGNSGSKNNGNSKQPSGGGSTGGGVTYTTNKNTSEEVKKNLEKIREVGKNLDESIEIIYDEETQSYTVKSKDGKDTGLFGYKYSTKDKIFYTAEDSWQRNFGFTEVYDKAAALGLMTYNTMRVHFDYGGEEWMLQFWKGQYGYAFVGAEIGVYTRPMGSDNGTYYDCADDEHKMYMTMDVYRQNPNNKNKYDKLFTRSRCRTWWCTGFIPGTLGFAQYNVPDENGTAKLKVDSRIEFHSEEMAQAFINSLSQITSLENNSAVSGTKRSVHFYQFGSEEEYEKSAASCKYVLCSDGKTVRVCYR